MAVASQKSNPGNSTMLRRSNSRANPGGDEAPVEEEMYHQGLRAHFPMSFGVCPPFCCCSSLLAGLLRLMRRYLSHVALVAMLAFQHTSHDCLHFWVAG